MDDGNKAETEAEVVAKVVEVVEKAKEVAKDVDEDAVIKAITTIRITTITDTTIKTLTIKIKIIISNPSRSSRIKITSNNNRSTTDKWLCTSHSSNNSNSNRNNNKIITWMASLPEMEIILIQTKTINETIVSVLVRDAETRIRV